MEPENQMRQQKNSSAFEHRNNCKHKKADKYLYGYYVNDRRGDGLFLKHTKLQPK
jgi:hypothetical protein